MKAAVSLPWMSFWAGWTPLSVPTLLPLLLGSSQKPCWFPQVGLQIFPCCLLLQGQLRVSLWNPPGTTSHEAFPVLSWIHLSGSEAQRCPLSPQLSPSRMLWEHKALLGFQSVLDATQRIPFIPTCLLLFHQHTQT